MVITAGLRIYRWRKHRDLTIRELAKATGIHKSRIQRMETGISEPKASEIEAIAAACGVTILRFLGHLPGERASGTERAA
jgi:transcriptional regulator with XRE-family HTH domain